MEQATKQTGLAAFLAACKKEFGEGAVITANNMRVACDVISTGSLKIDVATGIGGVPRGRIIEIFGHESSGKTTVALQVAANAQKQGLVLYVDNEHALDPTYATNLGVDIEKLIISQPSSAEECLGIIKTALSSGVFVAIVLDSISGLTPQAVIDGDVGDAHVGKVARLMSQNLQHFAFQANKHQTSVILINQTREKIGLMFGDPTTTSGGKAIRFYASMRIQTSRSTLTKDGEDVLGNLVKVKIIKNKLAPPFKECDPEIVYGEGFSREADVLDLGADTGIIEKSGSWYSYNGERLAQGKEGAKQFLVTNPAIADDIEYKIKEYLGITQPNQ